MSMKVHVASEAEINNHNEAFNHFLKSLSGDGVSPLVVKGLADSLQEFAAEGKTWDEVQKLEAFTIFRSDNPKFNGEFTYGDLSGAKAYFTELVKEEVASGMRKPDKSLEATAEAHTPVGGKARVGHVGGTSEPKPGIEYVAGHVSAEIVRDYSKKYGIELESDSIVSDKVKELQYAVGAKPMDGKMGPGTEKALLDYAKSHKMDVPEKPEDRAAFLDKVIETAKTERAQAAEATRGHDGNPPPPPTPSVASSRGQESARG